MAKLSFNINVDKLLKLCTYFCNSGYNGMGFRFVGKKILAISGHHIENDIMTSQSRTNENSVHGNMLDRIRKFANFLDGHLLFVNINDRELFLFPKTHLHWKIKSF